MTIIALFFHDNLAIGSIIAFRGQRASCATQPECQHRPETLASWYRTLSAVQSSCLRAHLAMSAFRLVVVPLSVLHSSFTVPTFDFLVVHQLCFGHAQAECNHITDFAPFSGPSSFKLFSNSCSWSNGGGSPASPRDSDMLPKTKKRAKTFEKLPDWNFDQRDWCADEMSPISQRQKNIALTSKTSYRGYNIDAAIYRYGPDHHIAWIAFLELYLGTAYRPRFTTKMSVPKLDVKWGTQICS